LNATTLLVAFSISARQARRLRPVRPASDCPVRAYLPVARRIRRGEIGLPRSPLSDSNRPRRARRASPRSA